jgi:uncharacterized membrane protein
MLAAAGLISLVFYPRLPNPTPTHWNIDGKADGYSSPLVAVLMVPGIMLLSFLMFLVLPKLSPKHFKMESWIDVYHTIMALVMALFLVIHIVVLRAGLGHEVEMVKVLISSLLLFFAIIGNLMGKVRRNFWVGVRTPWTLANETVWNLVHRRAARLWLVGGIAGAIAVWLGLPFWAAFAWLLAISLYPVLDSYLIWRRIEGGGSAA